MIIAVYFAALVSFGIMSDKTPELPSFQKPDNVFEIPLVIITGIWSFIKFIFGLMTFDIPGAPASVNGLIRFFLVITLGAAIAALFRGTNT